MAKWLWQQMRLFLGVLLFAQLLGVHAAFVDFTNCLDETTITSTPRLLQFMPLNVSARVVQVNDSAKVLNVTYYGNVTGQLFTGTYPPPNDPSWSDPDNSFGKIVDLEDGATKYTTLFGSFNFLSYTPYSAPSTRLCNSTINDACPLAPVFYENSSNINVLPGFSLAHDLGSSYAFSTIEANSRIQSGSDRANFYACINAYITPDLGPALKNLLTYLPLGMLIVVGIATVSAAILNPWTSTFDVFRWSSNYGRDEDVLRLVTPGFGDCIQYLQFVIFTGSLSLQYPGYYQPAVSRLGWSALLFNESLVTDGDGIQPVVDGIYQYRVNSRQGLDRITQLIGMTSPSDAWAGMMVWLVVIVACVILLTQIGFLLRWIYRQVKDVAPEDFRSKNWYFSVGNIVRIAMGFFLLPLVAVSMYQLVIASQGPTYAVALAAIVLAFIIAFISWMTALYVRVRPKSFFFDDLQTVLLYGPLYNTYRDDIAMFALVPLGVNFLRGIAIGAVQASGVAQIVILAICEVIMILTVNAIRPYSSATSMNVYQTCFASIRLFTIMLSIAFVPSLNVSSASRGWIGYAILLIHACVLVFGFFLNAIQTLIEVIARLAGAGSQGGRDAARGGLVKVFGMRQLSRRRARRDPGQRSSMNSNAQMMMTAEEKERMTMTNTRSRSISASSNLLLDGTKRKRSSRQMEGSSQGRQTPDGMSTTSRLSKTLTSPGAIVGLSKTDSKDPYYRPPRRNTNDFAANGGRLSLTNSSHQEAVLVAASLDDAAESSSHIRGDREEQSEVGAELTKTPTDYAVREVDFYYGVRGPALSQSGGTRKMRTGPADPTGKVSSARGWLDKLVGGKTKDKQKGFEVVRSAKAPPAMFAPTAEDDDVNTGTDKAIGETYKDDASAVAGPLLSPIPRTSDVAPALPAIETGGSIELPSRIGSAKSRNGPRPVDDDIPAVPPVPRRSSRRDSSPRSLPEDLRMPPTIAVPTESPSRSNRTSQYTTTTQQRLPFTRGASGRQHNRNSAAVSEISSYMDEPLADDELDSLAQPPQGRPDSVGFVTHHRASDNIKHSPDEAQIPHLSAVEYGYPAPQQQHPYIHEAQSPDEPFSPAWNGSSAFPSDGSQRNSRFRD